MNVINFSGHPAVQTVIVSQLSQNGKSVTAEAMTHFRSMVRAHDDLFGERIIIVEHPCT